MVLHLLGEDRRDCDVVFSETVLHSDEWLAWFGVYSSAHETLAGVFVQSGAVFLDGAGD